LRDAARNPRAAPPRALAQEPLGRDLATPQARADGVLKLVEPIGVDAGWWGPGERPADLAQAALLLASPFDRPAQGTVRILYFPTRPPAVAAFLGFLTFSVVFARSCGHLGPTAWLNFPVSLLGDAQLGRIREVELGIRRLYPAMLAPRPLVSFEAQAAPDAAVHVGADRPAGWNPAGADHFAVKHGLPLICVPSRTVAAMQFSGGPWA